MGDKDLVGCIEFIKGKFYYLSARSPPRDTPQTHYFTIDDELIYEPFFADFGPLNLGHVHTFSRITDIKLNDSSAKRTVFYSSHDGHKRANAAFLICAYMLIRRNQTPEEAFHPFIGAYPPFIPFRDASYGISTYNLTILDCLRGLHKAIKCGFYDFDTFNAEEYHHYEKVNNGDMNWIVPGKFLAFSGPANTKHAMEGLRLFTPEDYVPIFNRWGVTAVVRFNKKVYDRQRFTNHGIRHYDMYFVDGGVPSDAILRKFLEVAESEKTLAVHCKAGLGRTGTLIASYIMKHYRFTAAEIIGWLRIVRPGSVIGPQQHYLKDIEQRLWKLGDSLRKKDDRQPSASLSSSFESQFKRLTVDERQRTYTSNGSTFINAANGNSTSTLWSKYQSRSQSNGRTAITTQNNTSSRGNESNSYSSDAVSVSMLSRPSITPLNGSRPVTTTGLSNTMPSRNSSANRSSSISRALPMNSTPVSHHSLPVRGGSRDSVPVSISKPTLARSNYTTTSYSMPKTATPPPQMYSSAVNNSSPQYINNKGSSITNSPYANSLRSNRKL